MAWTRGTRVYGVYHPDYDAHVYRNIHFNNIVSEPINRGHDDEMSSAAISRTRT